MSDQAPQQPVLFEFDDDNALLFSSGELERSKRYTSEQVKSIEWKREAIIMLLASDWPVEHIAGKLHVNTRTVRAIAARSAQEVAGASKMFAKICAGLGARWLGLAKTKEHEASFLQLVTGAAIAIDKSVLVESMGQIADVTETKEAPDRAAAAAALRRLMSDQVDQAPGTDSHSDTLPRVTEGSVMSAPVEAPVEAPAAARPATVDQVGQPAVQEGPGGGQPAAGRSGSPMDLPAQGLQAKGPSGKPSGGNTAKTP